MLTGDLLRVRGSREEAIPAFLDPGSPRYRDRADALIRVTREALAEGLTRGELEDRYEAEIVGAGVDARLSRGLAKVVLDRCEFETESPLDPLEVRTRLFARGPTGSGPLAEGQPTTAQVLAEEAAALGCTPEVLQRAMYADLKENQVLRACPVPTGEWVLHRYNVALVQGLLLHARDVEITLTAPAPERAAQLFRRARFHGLMHRIERVPAGYRLVLDGPASVLRLTSRYGLQLATFFPALPLLPTPWSLSTDVNWKRSWRRLRVDSSAGLRSHLADTGAWVSREEEWFEERFRAEPRAWSLERGDALLDLGGEAVVVPQYTLRREGRVAWLEVIGVWRRGWLERRLDLLRRHDVPNLLLAVSRNLLGDSTRVDLERLDDRIVPFARIISPGDVLAAAERHARPEAPAPGSTVR